MSSRYRWGAYPEDWSHLDLITGVGDDLLPVVSNPGGVVSPGSSLVALGKVPSVYNRARQIVGIKGWPVLDVTHTRRDVWAHEPDYGICIRCSRIRALDIDVDSAQSAAIVAHAARVLGFSLPCRARSNSAKSLLAFEMPGSFSKRTVRTSAGVIEFLGNGQQFVAVGTHPSGCRYEWAGGLPDSFPVLREEAFEALWASLVRAFGVSAAATVPCAYTARRAEPSLSVPGGDGVGAWLEASGLVTGSDAEGAELYIECPWATEHTGASGPSATAYFVAGSRGYERGHFKCLHAHCEGRSDSDFLRALGYYLSDMDVLGAPEKGAGVDSGTSALAGRVVAGNVLAEPLPPFARVSRTGEIQPSLPNLVMALERPDFCGVRIGYDRFRDDVMFAPVVAGEDFSGGVGHDVAWRPWTDNDHTAMRLHLEGTCSFGAIGQELMRQTIALVSARSPFDSAISWLNGLRWDGIVRAPEFFARYFGAEPGLFATAVSRYLWTALAGRALVPGIKVDMVPVLVGEQGVGKSYGIEALVPSEEFYCTISLNAADDDLSRRMRGCLVGGIEELRGLGTRDGEAIKSFLTQRFEKWVPKFKEMAVTYPRRLVFIGSTNQHDFLSDETGNRRWLPLEVGVSGPVLRDEIVRDRDQLWAEAAVLFKEHGIIWQEAECLAAGEHERFVAVDPWQAVIAQWLEGAAGIDDGFLERGAEGVRIQDILREALGIETRFARRNDERRAGAVMRALGWHKKVVRVESGMQRKWLRH